MLFPMKIKEKKIYKALSAVMDPEMDISIVDLGLIRKVTVGKNDVVTIFFTLTIPGCPMVQTIKKDIVRTVKKLGFKSVKTKLSFDPPWSIADMSSASRAKLGI